MAKKKQKKMKHHSANAAPILGKMSLQDFAHAVFHERASQFQKNGTSIASVYEGLDLDAIRIKRRISSVVSVAEDIQRRYAAICPDVPSKFSLEEDWVTMNTYPVSAYDYVEKYVFSTLGAAIWILDYIRDHGKTDKLNDILCNSPSPADVEIPDVWDPCHSQQLLRHMVSIINNRNSDCPVTEKAIRKKKATVARVYMDRPTAENKIDHTVPSRRLYDQVISLIEPEALLMIESAYQEKYWDWLNRYFLTREIFNQEEMSIRSDIANFQSKMQTLASRPVVPIQEKKQVSILLNSASNDNLPAFNTGLSSDQFVQLRTLEHENRILFEKQEEFNGRFNEFTRNVGEFPLIPSETISNQYGEAIASIWANFEISEPYSMCMAFLSLLDKNSNLPWCYFPSVHLQSCYVCMLPWTRTRFISSCDDIWEHYDSDSGSIVPGPSDEPLSKKIKIPELDNWYRMQYHDTAKSHMESKDLYNLSHILYEVTGCLMPRTPERHLAALQTLNRYGINTKKANQNLLYCMALLGEAKHQTHITHFPVSSSSGSEHMTDTGISLQEKVIALREELSLCKQALQDTTTELRTVSTRNAQLQRQLTNRDLELEDCSKVIFGTSPTSITLGTCFPYRTASHIVVFSAIDDWSRLMKVNLPDVLFCRNINKSNSDALRKADTIWIQPKDISHDEFHRIIVEARKADTPVRIFPNSDVTYCAALLAKTDISSC